MEKKKTRAQKLFILTSKGRWIPVSTDPFSKYHKIYSQVLSILKLAQGTGTCADLKKTRVSYW